MVRYYSNMVRLVDWLDSSGVGSLLGYVLFGILLYYSPVILYWVFRILVGYLAGVR